MSTTLEAKQRRLRIQRKLNREEGKRPMSIAINVKSRDVEVTDGLRSYTEKRLQKLSKFLPNLREATVRECVEKNMHRVEVTLEGDGLLLRGEERTNDM